MIVEKQKRRATLLYRRKRAIIISLVIVAVLIVASIIVNELVNSYPYTDADGTVYYIKRTADRSYSIFDENDNELPVDDEYDYYVTPLGTLVDLDTETGSYETIAYVDTEYTEALDYNNRVLLFPHIEKDDIRSIEMHNSSGEYKFIRLNGETFEPDDTGEFVIEGSPLTHIDQDIFAPFYVSAGYTLSTRRIEAPIKDANGEFSEYGLVSETRINDDGEEYLHEPSYYIITDVKGNSHKVLIGDRLVTGGGYYVQYVALDGEKETKRETVYVLSSDIEDSLLQPVETFAKPTIVEEISLNNYYDVENFRIYEHDGETRKNTVGFTFIDLSEREHTINSSKPFVFDTEELRGYIPNSDAVFECLSYFNTTEFVGIKKLSPTNEDFVKYGLGKIVETEDEDGNVIEGWLPTPKYSISFTVEALDSNGNPSGFNIGQFLLISEKNENGNYYVYSSFHDGDVSDDNLLYTSNMIVEVAGHCLDFVTWKPTKWINTGYIDVNIAFCDTLTLKTPDYEASFKLDNSQSDQSQKISSELLKIYGKDSEGNEIDTFSLLTVVDKKGFVWSITPTTINVVNKDGEASTISSKYYATNKLGRNVLAINGYIDCADGRQVKVSADYVTVTERNGTKTEYVRFASTLFRLYYQTLLMSSIVDSYEMSPEEEQALIANKDNFLMSLTLTVTNDAYGKDSDKKYPEDFTTTYEFYRLTARKAYIVVNGSGGFYVNTSRVDKFVNDAKRFFAFEMIDATDKN